MSLHAIPLHADNTLTGVATLYTRAPRPSGEPPGKVAFLANTVGAALMVAPLNTMANNLATGRGGAGAASSIRRRGW